jgi:hypothetical protein
MKFVMHFPQWFFIVMLSLRLVNVAVHDNQLPANAYNFKASAVVVATWLLILYFGGFFTAGATP